jgi:hypothetical protein
MKIPANTAASAAKNTQTGEKTPQIVPNQPEAPQNPVPATDKDTPVLIQYSAPEPQAAPAVAAASEPPVATVDPVVAEKAKELVGAALDAAASAPSTSSVGTTTKVKMLKNHPKVGAFKGTNTELPNALAKELIADGYAAQVSATGEAVQPVYGAPTTAQLTAAGAAYARFLAAGGESEATEFMSPKFEELPADMQRCFVAAIDPTYGPNA